MTNLNEQQIMFGSGTPNGTQITLSANYQVLHTAVGGVAGQVDLVSVEIVNSTAAPIDVTIGWASNIAGPAAHEIIQTIAIKSGVVLVIDRRPLAKGLSVYAKGLNLYAFCYLGRLT